MSSSSKSGFLNFVQEFSMPLIVGVVAAVLFANVNEEKYHAFIEWGPLDVVCANAEPSHGWIGCIEGHSAAHDDTHAGEHDSHAEVHHTDDHAVGPYHPGEDGPEIKAVFGIFGHHFTLHFLINDIFMLFFFGIAAKEITESVLPGGALNPPSKAVNPLIGTIGGVVGPVGMYFALSWLVYGSSPPEVLSQIYNGWGIPTATDIALAWLVARMVFGSTHPAVNFLLLLAIADDAIGLGIIAIFYPNPDHPPQPIFLLVVLAAMAGAWFIRKRGTNSWKPFMIPGLVSWVGLMLAGLHPALALVPIVPFIPGPKTDTGFFATDDEVDVAQGTHGGSGEDHSPLHNFEHDLKLFVDLGLFFFGLMNAGVGFSSFNGVTWIVLASLIFGKLIGISGFSGFANAIGFKYPEGMGFRHIVVASIIAGLGLTVALFVAGEAFPGDSPYQGPAKMGALLTVIAAPIAIALGRMLNVRKLNTH